MNLEELDRLEKAVWKLENLNWYYCPYPTRNYEYENYILNKILYYIKTGITATQLEKKYKTLKKSKN